VGQAQAHKKEGCRFYPNIVYRLLKLLKEGCLSVQSLHSHPTPIPISQPLPVALSVPKKKSLHMHIDYYKSLPSVAVWICPSSCCRSCCSCKSINRSILVPSCSLPGTCCTPHCAPLGYGYQTDIQNTELYQSQSLQSVPSVAVRSSPFSLPSISPFSMTRLIMRCRNTKLRLMML